MALGEIQWLQWKSKSTKERDAKEYEEWAFPYGQAQRDALSAILKSLFPKEENGVALVCFLTAKEIVCRYIQIWDLAEHYDYSRKHLGKDLIRYKRMFGKGKPRYIYTALAFADLAVTPALDYPSETELLAAADALEREVEAALNK